MAAAIWCAAARNRAAVRAAATSASSVTLIFILIALHPFAAHGKTLSVTEQPDYRQFLEAKRPVASSEGFAVDPDEINPALKPHIRMIVPWMLAGGRRALFARFGMQKTTAQLECMRLIHQRTKSPTLIVTPLGARLSFFHDAQVYFTGAHAVRLNFIKSDAEIDDRAINLTNTESVREGKVNPTHFAGTSFDEGDMLRNMSSKTFWEFARRWTSIPYRFVATATPDPNEYAELLAYASYLDIMDVGQARTRWFKRNSEKADDLTLYAHKEREFWLWVATWALFIQRPSDLDPSFSDDGYVLPELDVRWHEVPTNHKTAGQEPNGQFRLIKDAAAGVQEIAQEKRESIGARVAKMMDLRAEDPSAHRIIWHDYNAERDAIKAAAPEIVTVTGADDLDKREGVLIGFARGAITELAGKPEMIGSGGNYQAHCAWAIFLDITYKFRALIQAIHRLQRYGQRFRVRIDFIYTEAQREQRRELEAKWVRHIEQAERMTAIVREFGLGRAALASLERAMEVTRQEARGERFVCINSDCIDETRAMADNSLDLVVTSIPFEGQYEYTPNYRDLGHTETSDHFFEQMDFLTPQLLRVLKPGRLAAIHCKDRTVEGSRSGLGFQSIKPFGALTMFHFMRHGFAYLGTVTIGTDVVRENAGTYRLGWAEQCKDGSRQGFGLPEYLHVFRKPQTDRSRGYADDPVVKLQRDFDEVKRLWTDFVPKGAKSAPPGTGFSLPRWQVYAEGTQRSSGNRLLTPREYASLDWSAVIGAWRHECLTTVYDRERHVAIGEALHEAGNLPTDFGLIPVHQWHPWIWTDITRMVTMNSLQTQQGREKHICPLQFDIIDRAIEQCTMPGEEVYDPFGGVGSVAYRAVLAGRRAITCELNPTYHADAVRHCEAAERKAAVPTLFDLLAIEAAQGGGEDVTEVDAPFPYCKPVTEAAE
jgi:DNA modification methylase